jgi:iron complex transport system ATP-binding protein
MSNQRNQSNQSGLSSGLNNRRSTVNRLSAENVTLAYDQRVIARQLSVEIPDNSFTVIVGPNACGKSTLLRALSRMLKPTEGRVLLDGQVIQSMPAKKVARTLGLLPQSSIAPDGITVGDLVGRGRYPHQGILRQWSSEDERVVQESMTQTGVAELADRYVDELSGGQRQRVWIAMALAQQTPLLLLDEPTTYLDIQHQIDVLDLCAELHEEQGRTLVAVLHDLNHAARYATHLIALREGAVIAEGAPSDIVTAELVEEVFGLRCQVIDDPETGTPLGQEPQRWLQKFPEAEQVEHVGLQLHPARAPGLREVQAAVDHCDQVVAGHGQPDLGLLGRRALYGLVHHDPAVGEPAYERDVEVGDPAADRTVHGRGGADIPIGLLHVVRELFECGTALFDRCHRDRRYPRPSG